MVTGDNIADRLPLDRTIGLISDMTYEEFFSDVDEGISEADLGLLEDAVQIADEVAIELGMTYK